MNSTAAWVLGWTLLNLPVPAYGDDVYNIYLQKAPGPQNVPQGADKSTHAKPEPSSPAPATSPLAEDTSVAVSWPETPQWRGSIGRADVVQEWPVQAGGQYTNHYSALSLGVQYSFSRYFATDLNLVMPDSSKQVSLRGSLGVAITPLHLQLFGREFIDMSILGGLVTTELRPNSGYVVRPSAGFGFNFHLSDRFSISTQHRSFNGGSHSTVGLTYRF